MLMKQVQAGCMHIGGKPGKVKGVTQGWEHLASTLCGKGPFKDFAEVKGPAMKKADEAIVTAASSEFVNTSGSSSDSNSLYWYATLRRSIPINLMSALDRPASISFIKREISLRPSVEAHIHLCYQI
jgi:hypothetical protein